MVSQGLKKHASDIVYLQIRVITKLPNTEQSSKGTGKTHKSTNRQKTKPCIRKHLITKADRSLVDCLCECVDNILRGNVPLTKLQKEKLKRNKAGLRALTKKSVSLKKKKAILQKGGFVGSLLAPIASVVAPLLSTLFQ